MTEPTRRQFVARLGTAGAAFGLAGCLGRSGAGLGGRPHRTAYVGAYHWGFVLVDGTGTERDQLRLDRGTRLDLVAVNTEAEPAVAQLPAPVRAAIPEHEALEARNEDRLPAPPSGDMDAALHVANQQTPDHSLAVMPAGHMMGGGMWGPGPMASNQLGGGMGGGMMLPPIPLPHDMPRPATAQLVADRRGGYTLSCQTYCGYGHPAMQLARAFVVR